MAGDGYTGFPALASKCLVHTIFLTKQTIGSAVDHDGGLFRCT